MYALGLGHAAATPSSHAVYEQVDQRVGDVVGDPALGGDRRERTVRESPVLGRFGAGGHAGGEAEREHEGEQGDRAWRDTSSGRAPVKEDAMLIVTVLRSKGDFVATVPPDRDRPRAPRRPGRAPHRCRGGVDGRRASPASCRSATSCGISATRAASSSTARCRAIMTTDVVTCGRETAVEDLARDDDRAADPPRAGGRRRRRARRHREHRRRGEEPHLRARGRTRRPRRLHRHALTDVRRRGPGAHQVLLHERRREADRRGRAPSRGTRRARRRPTPVRAP